MARTFAWFQLPEEECELVAYLAKVELWAFAWSADPRRPEYPPAPVADFFREHGDALTRAYQQTSARWHEENIAYWADPTATRPNPDRRNDATNVVYIGGRDRMVSPRVREFEHFEGGRIESTDQESDASSVRPRSFDTPSMRIASFFATTAGPGWRTSTRSRALVCRVKPVHLTPSFNGAASGCSRGCDGGPLAP